MTQRKKELAQQIDQSGRRRGGERGKGGHTIETRELKVVVTLLHSEESPAFHEGGTP
jgi:hypothetical protein